MSAQEFLLNGASVLLTQAGRGIAPLRENIGFHVGDDSVKVLQRRRELASELGRPIIWMNQTHSSDVALVTCVKGRMDISIEERPIECATPDNGVWGPLNCDGIIVDARNWDIDIGDDAFFSAQGETTLGQRWDKASPPVPAVMTADCMPLLFSACEGRIIAAIHAGRVGFEKGILARTLHIFSQRGVGAEEIHIYIGPAICGRCYEVHLI